MIAVGSAAASETGHRVTVWVHNYANVPESTLEQAQDVASSVFERTGFGLEWVRPATANGRRMDGADLVLRTVSESMVKSWKLDGDHLAFAIVVKNSRSAYIAGVIVDRVEKTARRLGYPFGEVTGYVMAHELGHLLLADKRHSATGIMSYPVDKRYLSQTSQGRMLFTRSQVRTIQSRISQRIEMASTARAQ